MTGSSRQDSDRGGGSRDQDGVHTREVPLGELDTWERAHRHADDKRKRPGKELEDGEGRKEASGCAPLCTDTKIGCLTNKSHTTECAILGFQVTGAHASNAGGGEECPRGAKRQT